MDADVFIQAKNQHYAFSICPGFWDSLIGYHETQDIFSIDYIKQELLRGDKEEDLVKWVKKKVPKGFFLTTQEQSVTEHYKNIIFWVQRSVQFSDAAKAKFATEADGWLGHTQKHMVMW